MFRAIRKVFASFYNINAYLERLRHGIYEIEVGMAVLVHHSFPDEIELANGVAKLRWNAGTHRQLYLVSQAGAVSVTNPEPGSIPEEVAVDVFSFGTYASVIRYSNLVQLGATVLEFDAEYLELTELLLTVGERYAQETGLSVFTLEFEYKKVAPASRGGQRAQCDSIPDRSSCRVLLLPGRVRRRIGESPAQVALDDSHAELLVDAGKSATGHVGIG